MGFLQKVVLLIVVAQVCDVYSRHHGHKRVGKRDAKKVSDNEIARDNVAKEKYSEGKHDKMLPGNSDRVRDESHLNIKPSLVSPIRRQADPDAALPRDTRRIEPFITKPPPKPVRNLKDLSDCMPEVFPPYTTPSMPKHIDAMFFRVTPKAGHYPVGYVKPQGFFPPAQHMTDCERLYLEHLKREKYSDSQSGSESLEILRSPLGKKEE